MKQVFIIVFIMKMQMMLTSLNFAFNENSVNF